MEYKVESHSAVLSAHATHEITRMVEDPRSLRYSNRNWSAAFTCPECGRRVRQNTNRLGRKKMHCDGRVVKALPRTPLPCTRQSPLEILEDLVLKLETMRGALEENVHEGHEECYPEIEWAREVIARAKATKVKAVTIVSADSLVT